LNIEKKTLFDLFFYPKTVAVIGVSSNENAFGSLYFKALISYGFKGKLYPVNPKGGSFFGITAYTDITDVPDSIDVAIVCVPAKGVSHVQESCLAKGIRAAVVLSGGFSEAGGEGKKYEQEIAAVAAKGIQVLGPNCFGVYCPGSGLTLLPGSNFPHEVGPIALVTQSGQFSEIFVQQTRGLGFRFSKVISFGNALDLNECDFLEYLATDPETKLITMYLEGVKQGRRFLETMRRVTRIKPVLLWKVGMTRTGTKAASSHTGSLAGSEIIWDAFFKQTGAIRIDTFDDLIDTVIATLNVYPYCGPNVAVISGSGGGAVTGADACERAGLEMPTFPAAVQQKISALLPSIGTGVSNPVDLSSPIMPASTIGPILEYVAALDQIDTILLGRMFFSVRGPTLVLGLPKSYEQGRETLRDIPLMIKEKYRKSVVVTLNDEVTDENMLEFEADRRNLRSYYLNHGIAAYPTFERGVKALANVVKYKERFREKKT
jgi:acyl-CoA synthetase (NDP forming)